MTTLISQLQITNLAPSGSIILAHGLNIDGVGIVPDRIESNSPALKVISGGATNIAVSNVSAAPATGVIQCCHMHSITRVINPSLANLPTQPFIPTGPSGIYTSAQGTAQIEIPDNVAGIDIDASQSNSFKCTLEVVVGNTRQLDAPTRLVAGFTYIFEFVQPAAGAAQGLTFDAIWKFTGLVPPALTAANNAVDVITSYYDGTKMRSTIQNDI